MVVAPVQLTTAVASDQLMEVLPISLPDPVNRTMGLKFTVVRTVVIPVPDRVNVFLPVASGQLVRVPALTGKADPAFTHRLRLVLTPPGLWASSADGQYSSPDELHSSKERRVG